MIEQINLFDILEPDKFCNDDHINEIVEFIENDFSKLNLKLKEKKYEVWEHVPNLGYRLSMVYDLKNCEQIKNIYDKQAKFNSELNKSCYNDAVEIADNHDIELSIAVTPFFIMITSLNRRVRKL